MHVRRRPPGTGRRGGQRHVTVEAAYESEPVADVDPADNTTTFSVRVTG
ncbi:hypothetical protein O7622_00990 [Micromonospora sp. WMMD1076]|nr:hypothetical protein [Micromonospora sp. WMMD1076]WFF07205.1 hypothetical protein O7622_00990 [Micromonospora sp. WMMD1076]